MESCCVVPIRNGSESLYSQEREKEKRKEKKTERRIVKNHDVTFAEFGFA